MSFTLELSQAIQNIEEHTEKVVRGTIGGVAAKIIKATPVGDPKTWKSPPPSGYRAGTLRGAWNASVGTIDTTITNKTDESGSSTVNEAFVVANKVEMGQTYYLTNPQPYAYRVEYGWSQQAPGGMVRPTVMAAEQELRKYL